MTASPPAGTPQAPPGGQATPPSGALPPAYSQPPVAPPTPPYGRGGAAGEYGGPQYPPQYPQGPPPSSVEPPDRTPMWITLLVVLLLVIAGLVFLLVNDRGEPGVVAEPDPTSDVRLRVPNVVGLHFSEAERELGDVGFDHVSIEFSERDDVDENVVFQQNPRAGLLLAEPNDPDNPITLFAAAPRSLVLLPNVVGRTYEEAEAMLVTAGFSVERIDVRNDNLAIGLVTEQSIPSTEQRPAGTIVTLTVSAGRGEVEVPRLVGQTVDDARVTLARLGLVDRVEREFSTEFSEGTVIRSSPEAAQPAERGSVITLIVSDGPEELVVPALADFGTTLADRIEAELLALGFTVKRTAREVSNLDVNTDVVRDISPDPGTVLIAGSEVILHMFKPPEVATVPSLQALETFDPDGVAEALTELGFEVRRRAQSVAEGDPADGQVISLDPAPGTDIRLNYDTITLVIGEAEPSADGEEADPSS